MSEEIRIRPAETGDVSPIARVHVDTWRTAYRGFLPDRFLAELAYADRERMWQRVLGELRERHIAVVADHPTDGVVGFALAAPSEHPHFAGEVLAIYVLADHQGGGIGRRLIEATAGALVERGMRSMMLWVLRDNPSRGFYEALGGRLVGEKMQEIGGVAVVEIAYGWDDAERLRSGDRSGPSST